MNYGYKVIIKFRRIQEDTILRNVTEIHYGYRRTMIAFESDIHGTGITYDLKDIKEFETRLEQEKQSDF